LGMESERKLKGSEYHLKRMEELYGKDHEVFMYELEAFLIKTRSVLDILLYDFAEKLQLGIDRNRELNDHIFEETARKHGNDQAIKFIEWWRKRRDEVKEKNFKPLLDKRNIAVHRGSVRPNIQKITLYDTAVATESITIIKKNETGNIIEIYESPGKSTVKPIEPKPAEIDWYFEEYPDKNILNVCREFLENIRQMVEEAKTNFN